ncbi:unnamed protein product [Arabidopsis thaliana]|nr:unnamed protein product [Arabidopsis thaliana]VYS52943.1 unnamed protein product [Arabidopsis thaliana]
MTHGGKPGYGIERTIIRPEWRCYVDEGCPKGQGAPCEKNCKNVADYGICIGIKCCCFDVIPVPPT